MLNHQTEQELPTNEEFITWVKRAIADLNAKPSHFLVDKDRPGSVNRVSEIMKKPENLRLRIAHRLESELLSVAEQKGKTLLPILPRCQCGKWIGR
ncbi:hypothetical protein [Epibacterium ulvae]|uniref:hypothetical protein n=1 Tax=Epibacterium ulvae TaxID=1156985 RepID=UPI00248FC09C|nr:hypothetical protein [Epibacterium ulvae]